jgi:hypothetical protein
MEYSNTTNIEAYKEIIRTRTCLKGLQQISWDMGNIEKRYPLSEVQEDDLPALVDIYQGLIDRLLSLQSLANPQ